MVTTQLMQSPALQVVSVHPSMIQEYVEAYSFFKASEWVNIFEEHSRDLF